jgi:hypothetical protein
MALADINASNAKGVANMLDVVGYNSSEKRCPALSAGPTENTSPSSFASFKP